LPSDGFWTEGGISTLASQCAAARQLRDLRARVKAARAVVAAHPGMANALARDWRKAAWFSARFGVTESMKRQGVPNEVGTNRKTAGDFSAASW